MEDGRPQEPEDLQPGLHCAELSMADVPSPWEEDIYHIVSFYTKGSLGSDT